MTLDHASLCGLAVTWLKRPWSKGGPGCTLAISETQNSINSEVPDAIGWRAWSGYGSILVEVKVSLSDFMADFSKSHRKNIELGVGMYRYYMAPKGVIPIDRVPQTWGIIEVCPRGRIKVVRGHVALRRGEANIYRHESYNWHAEISMLTLCLNRVGDPQKVQEMLRESSNRNARLIKSNEAAQQRISKLQERIFTLEQKQVLQEKVT